MVMIYIFCSGKVPAQKERGVFLFCVHGQVAYSALLFLCGIVKDHMPLSHEVMNPF